MPVTAFRLRVVGLIGASALAGCLTSRQLRAADKLIWFEQPAAQFTESSPLGNGHLGAMIYGGIDDERILLNESGMWSGGPQEADRPGAAAALPEIRRLLLEGKNEEAEKLVGEQFTCAGLGSGRGRGSTVPFGCYQTLGELRLHFETGASSVEATHYRRELDLSTATARISYERAGIRFVREAFVSAPDAALVIRMTADHPGSLSFELNLDRKERANTTSDGDSILRLTGQLSNGSDGEGVRFASSVRVVPRGGSVSSHDHKLTVRNADEVLIVLTAATDIKTFAGRKVEDAEKTAAADLTRAAARSYAVLRSAHVSDYQKWFNRVDLQLGGSGVAVSKPTPERLRLFAEGGADPSLAALYFDFGRYLLISSSRPGGLPPNLQGIWAEEIQTPWNGDWHLNVNAQMNYWPAEVCNLSELHKPLFDLIASLQGPGARTAKSYYGARGWVAHVVTNPWGFTSPAEAASWGSTTTGSAWLCQHLWDHYRFTGDKSFLEWAYPIMKGSALFYLDVLIAEPTHQWLVTAPSNSPENEFVLPNGAKAHVCLGSTFDEQVLRYLFDAVIEGSRILGVDPELRSELTEKRAKLAPTRVGSDGRVMEWQEEYGESDPHHRHSSHLWGLYPGNEINPTATPELAAAARKSLEARGDEGTGWGLAFKLALWARLGDGPHAYTILKQHLAPARKDGDKTQWTGGTYPNLFDAHPPFQIDGNLGGAAAVAELLLQSQAGELSLLPALPPAWPDGSVYGLRARGGFEVALIWKAGQITSAVVRSTGGTTAKLRAGNHRVDLTLKPGETARFDGELQRL